MTVLNPDFTLTLPHITLTGSLEYHADTKSLVLETDEGPEVLTTNIPEIDIPAELGVFLTIKDYSEHYGVAEALADKGIVRIADCIGVGPFDSPVFVVEVING